MRYSVRMPKVGDTADTIVIESWSVEVGSVIVEGDALLDAETGKAIMTIPSPVAGTVVELLFDVDDEVAVGEKFVVIEG